MTFQIVSVGWNCAPFAERTLDSILAQSVDDWRVRIVVDPSSDGTEEVVENWLKAHPDNRFSTQFNKQRQFAVRNQVEALEALDPDDDDVIVWLDLDGDQFAHEDVLERLQTYYKGDTLLTFGSFLPVPNTTEFSPATPFPRSVIASNGYRDHILNVSCCFNHLRTMKGVVYRNIPPSHFRWRSGKWYEGGTDYIFMCAGLELAGSRHKYIKEILCLYNNANPNADFKVRGRQSSKCTVDYLKRPPLEPLPKLQRSKSKPSPISQSEPMMEETMTELFMSAEKRREVLADYGSRFGLNVFIETGTNDGETPWVLKDNFRELHTIELGSRQYRLAVQRFADYPHVHCHRGDSAVVLPRVLSKVSEPALIWLDGHYSGPGTAQGSKNTPVVEELEAIFRDGRSHVVLIDDARCFYGGAENPIDGTPAYDHYGTWTSLEKLRELSEANGYVYEEKNDIIRLTPQ